MLYLYVQIDTQEYVCTHGANDPVSLKPAIDGNGTAYTKTQIKIEQGRLNDHLESQGVSNYSIRIQ